MTSNFRLKIVHLIKFSRILNLFLLRCTLPTIIPTIELILLQYRALVWLDLSILPD